MEFGPLMVSNRLQVRDALVGEGWMILEVNLPLLVDEQQPILY